MPKSKKQEELEQQVGELTRDLQRTRADFENYRKRSEADKASVCINRVNHRPLQNYYRSSIRLSEQSPIRQRN